MDTQPTFVLVPGAGGSGYYWHLLVEELERRGRPVIPVDLPAGDEEAGLAEYADAVVAAIGDRSPVVLVAQSLGGFTAPLVCERVPVQMIVMLNAMVPSVGESPGDWWGNTGQQQAAAEMAEREGRPTGGEFDPHVWFFHDVPSEVAQALMAHEVEQADKPFDAPWPMAAWPDVPTRFLQGREDRLFPLEFQRRVVRERLGIPVDEMPGGHLLALSRPRELADRLEAYLG